MGNTIPYTVKKELEPLYFSSKEVPKRAFTFQDATIENNPGKCTPEELQRIRDYFPKSIIVDNSIKENPYRVPLGKCELFLISSIDHKCILLHNGQSIILGAVNCCIFNALAWATTFEIIHEGPFEIFFYEIGPDIKSDVTEIPLLYTNINGNLYGYRAGVFGRIHDGVEKFTVRGCYKPVMERSNTTTGRVISNEIKILLRHSDIKKYTTNVCELIYDTIPPYIVVSVEMERLNEFKEWTNNILNNVRFEAFDACDMKEVPMDEDLKLEQATKDLNLKLGRIKVLIEQEVIYEGESPSID